MAQLRITVGKELSLIFTCASYAKVRKRALQFVGDAEKLKAACKTSVESAKLEFCLDEDADSPVWEERPWGGKFDAFFFDNADYNVNAELMKDGGCSDLRVKSRFAADEGTQKFARLSSGMVRSGVINFENDVGNFGFTLQYAAPGGTTKEYTFSGEVLSQKLDSRADWKEMINDVESRYAMLAADYLRRTSHSFDRTHSKDGKTPDLIWWNLFEAEREVFFKAIRTILDRPRRRLRRVEEFVRADQLRRITPILENQVGEFRRDAGHLYRVEYDSHSNDTPENRFVKYAIQTIGKRYERLRKLICQESQFGSRISEGEKERMRATGKWFQKKLAHPFFKGIGRFEGIRQLSLTLQNAPGYATVTRTFAILNASYMLFEGIRQIETKSIADLYEIWCFLKVEDIVRACCSERFGSLLNKPEANHGELNGKFVRQLGTGARSEVIFKVGSVELARIIYNPKISNSERKKNDMPNTVVPTGLTDPKGQIPDIVLQLSRRSMNKEAPFRLTYLFDAKYRIEDVEEANGGVPEVMRPPQDAIDQMHRYRDAIYYEEDGADKGAEGVSPRYNPALYKKEVIGGYVLFPGICSESINEPDTGKDCRPNYFTSIDKVNIGAIPLRPNSDTEYSHLMDFIKRILDENPTLEMSLDSHNPQKGEVLGNASQAAIAEGVVYGTYTAGSLEWIDKTNLYNLPTDTAKKMGIYGLDDARKRRVLVLSSVRGTSKVIGIYKIAGCEGIVTKEQLRKGEEGVRPPYFHEPSWDSYYLFRVMPLIKPMENVKDILKLVMCDGDGVRKGVANYAAANGFEVGKVANPDEALRICGGIALINDRGEIPASLRGVFERFRGLRRGILPPQIMLKIDSRISRERMVQWLRTILKEHSVGKFSLYVDGMGERTGGDVEAKSEAFIGSVLPAV